MAEQIDGRMSILTRQFLVRPNGSLLTRLRDANNDFAVILRQNILWVQRLGQRSCDSMEQSLRFIKLLHICSLAADFGECEELEALTGKLAISTDFFDQNWEV